MKLILKSIISTLLVLLLVSCGTNDLIELNYEIEGPSNLYYENLVVDHNLNDFKDEIESNYYLLETTENTKKNIKLIFDYDDFNFGTNGTFHLLISIDPNDDLALEVELKVVHVTLKYEGREDVYYNLSVFITFENENVNYLEFEVLENTVISMLLPSDFPDVEELGYKFTYWSYDVNGRIKLGPNDIITSDVNLYTNWEKVIVEEPQKTIDIFYMNDLHGQVFHDPDNNVIGLSNAYEFIKRYETLNNTDSIFLFGGDIFQGTLISSASEGAVLIELLNAVEADGIVLGNHEFDWGIESITKYFDQSTQPLKANFPLLGTNAVHKATNKPIEGLSPFNTIQIGDVTVGVVGVIDEGLESSIMQTKVANYKFQNPLLHTANQTEILRTSHNADLVIAGLHGGDDVYYSYNDLLATYRGDNLVDVVLNAHRHFEYQGTINRSHSYDLIAMQSGSSGSNLGHIKLYLDDNKNITYHEYAQYRPYDELFSQSNLEIDQIIDRYYLDVSSSYETTLIEARSSISRDNLANYMARISREYTNSDIGLQNAGGTRSDIKSGPITHADLYQVFSFDNKVMSVEVIGSELKTYLSKTHDFISYRNGINNISDLDNNTYYRVAVNEYTYSSIYNPFLNGINSEVYPTQDIVIKNTIERINEQYFDINHPNVWDTNNNLSIYYNNNYYQSNYINQYV